MFFTVCQCVSPIVYGEYVAMVENYMVENYREPLSIIESEREEMIEVLQPQKSDIVLDVATGPGYQALALASRVKKVYSA
jgi:ubiquinone/menaquinone biosynthesis C-methylase UbiE